MRSGHLDLWVRRDQSRDDPAGSNVRRGSWRIRIWLAAGVAVVAAVVAAGAQGATRSESATAAFPTISAPADVIVSEGDTTVDLVVKLSEPSASAVSVHFDTPNSTAVST